MKPKILVSRCLEFEACRYDGGKIKSDFIKRLKPFVEFVTICPEVEIGLSVPREAIRLIKTDQIELVGSTSGLNHTNKMKQYVDEQIKTISGIHGAILKSKSPTCGIDQVKVYKSHGKLPCLEEKSKGFFGGRVADTFDIPVEDEGRLLNYTIRDHFLTRIYTMAAYEEIKKSKKKKEIIRFQSDNKYLLMAYHQRLQKEMGHLIATCKDETLFDQYEKMLHEALRSPLKSGRNINMMMHIFGYFSKQLSLAEKDYFSYQLRLYKETKIPYMAVMSILYSWVLRFDIDYLKSQTIFSPYPREILDVMDSGKGIR
jgi:uncharacterized protein YbgA (DUF1722 family)/uncharacterized protein YbbK (DUF523 family)